jgi:hypothetical protein
MASDGNSSSRTLCVEKMILPCLVFLSDPCFHHNQQFSADIVTTRVMYIYKDTYKDNTICNVRDNDVSAEEVSENKAVICLHIQCDGEVGLKKLLF